jgi:hypothetical protein
MAIVDFILTVETQAESTTPLFCNSHARFSVETVDDRCARNQKEDE